MAAITYLLPEDVVVDIMARLPVKSLKRFKCVSLSWRSLIHSPQFVSSHFSFSKNKTCPLIKYENYIYRKAMFMKLSNRTLDVVADFEKPPFGMDIVSIKQIHLYRHNISLINYPDWSMISLVKQIH